jgi:hypothetical protein
MQFLNAADEMRHKRLSHTKQEGPTDKGGQIQ